ncbi:MAG: T9SS C-terminal target domain-containing protein [Bacteroidetes bacterium]|nr:MAG: T9SS C-terminal target domain-containing protein [Bacteroidota bacterium]REK00980.1 MAG: T9SS C-terminal target domain-containing protein [Bacteroidota bacterium]REK34583.1 MAG: T9SS C-terminal target domain-containing protein [Bacteroidota bacterium]REK51842.1 MAG: T9SS C-terminal target domain-containing protein [Bacteroidota bacterium]
MNKLLLYYSIFFLMSILNTSAQNIKINEICSSNYSVYEDEEDDFGDWVEFYNPGSSSISMAGMYLTDDINNRTKFRIPASTSNSSTSISSRNHRVFFLDNETFKGPRHANFKLDSSGDFIALVASDGVTIIDSVTVPRLNYDVSFGRMTDGSSTWTYFAVPTPDDDNTGGGYLGIMGKANISMNSGFYQSSIQVTLSYPDPQAIIYYSLNGNEPSPTKGKLYTGPITISNTRALRARVYKANYIPGEVNTRSYLINRNTDLPILSVVTDSSHLWDEWTGIYTFGYDDYDHYYPYYGANFWKDWKRPGHIDLFEANGSHVVSQNLNISISGNTSRVYAQKSMNFEAKGALGKSTIQYQLFPHLPVTEFKAFKVRNGGSDWSSTGIRDAFNHSLMEGAMDVDHQYNRPVILYINGDYWGVISMTEKIDEHFISGHHPSVNKDSVDLLFSNAEAKLGDNTSYNAMISYIQNNPMSSQSNYNYIKNQIDITSYINYYQARIYYASTDWPHKNIYYWRPKNNHMKWRWIMWDTDRSTLLTRNPSRMCNYTDNTLSWAISGGGSSNAWSRFLLSSLLTNNEFKRNFITQYAHNMNFSFCPLRVDSVLNMFRGRLQNELPAHILRWKDSNDTLDYYTAGYYKTLAEWHTEVDTIKLFFDNRANHMRKFVMQQFSISDTSRLTLAKIPAQGGVIEIDTFRVPEVHCNLVYFNGYPVTIRAVANPGFVFTGWNSSGGSTAPLTWNPARDTTITAYFTPASVTEPVLPSSNFAYSSANCASLNLNWTSGDGLSRMVVVKASSPVDVYPQDNQFYTANATFGSGSNLGAGNYVVYSGSGNSCSINGLTPGIVYHFAVIEFNSGGGFADYNTSTYLSANAMTSGGVLSVTSSSNSVCAGDSVLLSASGGVSYNWSPSAGLSSVTGSQVMASPSTNTTYTVQAIDNGGCQLSSDILITVLPLPIVSLASFADVCEMDAPKSLGGGTPSGGIYTGTGVAGGLFDPALAGQGTHLITYTYTMINGCVNSASSSITVNASPVVTLGSFSDVCEDALNFSLSGGSPAGGTYSGNGVVNDNFDPALAGAGIHQIVYTYTDASGCIATASASITVNALPVVSMTPFTDVCRNDASFTLNNGSPAGGTYTGNGVQAGQFDPAQAGVGYHQVTYAFSNAAGCVATATEGIQVNELPQISIGSDTTICASHSIMLDAGSGLSSYIWSTGSVSQSIIVDSSGTGLGTVIIFMTGTNSFGCTATDSVRIEFDVCAGVSENEKFPQTVVYPNPFRNEIHVYATEDKFRLSIMDVTGKLLLDEFVIGNYFIARPEVSPGVYFIRIESLKEGRTFRVVKTD